MSGRSAAGSLRPVSKVTAHSPVRIRVFEMLKASGKEFGQDKASRMSAAIAYRTVFALAPLLLVAVSVAALFLDDPATDCEPGADGSCETIQQQLVAQVSDNLSPELAETVDTIMTNASQGAATTGILGTAIFLFTASSLFFEIQSSLNTIFHAPEERTKGIVALLRGRAIGALAVVLLGGILVVLFAANAVVSGAGSFILDLVEDAGLDRGLFEPLLTFAGPLVTLLLLILVFAVQFQTFTVVRIPWKAAWRGGAVTAIVFAAGAIGVGFYFSLQADGGNGGGFSAGGFAGGAVLILFTVFILAQIFLFGAEFTKTYADFIRHGDVVQPSVRSGGVQQARHQRRRGPGGRDNGSDRPSRRVLVPGRHGARLLPAPALRASEFEAHPDLVLARIGRQRLHVTGDGEATAAIQPLGSVVAPCDPQLDPGVPGITSPADRTLDQRRAHSLATAGRRDPHGHELGRRRVERVLEHADQSDDLACDVSREESRSSAARRCGGRPALPFGRVEPGFHLVGRRKRRWCVGQRSQPDVAQQVPIVFPDAID